MRLRSCYFNRIDYFTTSHIYLVLCSLVIYSPEGRLLGKLGLSYSISKEISEIMSNKDKCTVHNAFILYPSRMFGSETSLFFTISPVPLAVRYHFLEEAVQKKMNGENSF